MGPVGLMPFMLQFTCRWTGRYNAVHFTVYLLLGLVGMMLLMTVFTSIPELDVTVWFLPSLQYQVVHFLDNARGQFFSPVYLVQKF